MSHPTLQYQLAQQRREQLLAEADRDRLARAARAASYQEPRERFSVRDLRWLLLRPVRA
jgi:hypothetical protein